MSGITLSALDTGSLFNPYQTSTQLVLLLPLFIDE
jgi:hypothetical protein